MSSSDAAIAGKRATLIAEGPSGVEIRVVDGTYTTRASGSRRLTCDLPEGIYFVTWNARGHEEQQIVRLLPLEKPLVVRGGEKVSAGLRTREQAIGALLGKLDRRSMNHGDAGDIVVLVENRTPHPTREIESAIRLFDTADVAMRSDGTAVGAVGDDIDTETGRLTRLYHVASGYYRLQFPAKTGDTLSQTIYVAPRRRTVIFMRIGTAEVLVADGDSYRTDPYNGIDPPRTTMMSVAIGNAASLDLEQIRLSETMLYDLAFGRGMLDDDIIAVLLQPAADPLARLYAAAQIVQRIGAGKSPSPDEPAPIGEVAMAAFRHRWLDIADKLLDMPVALASFADATIWRARLRVLRGLPSIALPPLTAPPMLDCSWRAAIERSAADPDFLPDRTDFRAAASGAVAAAPWLVWRAAAAKGGLIGTDAEVRDLSDNARHFVEQVGQLFPERVASSLSAAKILADSLATVAPETSNFANRISAFTSDWLSDIKSQEKGNDLAAELTRAFRMPARLLSRKITETLDELQSRDVLGSIQPRHPSGNIGDPVPAPLRRPISVSDDPHKGRFGGLASRDGFTLGVVFQESELPEQVLVHLAVVAATSVADGEIAQFFLHDTFRPDCVAVALRQNRAELRLAVSGGFTVGVWMETRDLALELDLSTVAGAPPIIVER